MSNLGKMRRIGNCQPSDTILEQLGAKGFDSVDGSLEYFEELVPSIIDGRQFIRYDIESGVTR